MKPVRTAAHALLASVFVVDGIRTLIKPGERLEAARQLTDKVGPALEKIDPRIPSDPLTLLRIKAAADVVGGLALATGRFTRPAAAVLAAGMVPSAVAAYQGQQPDKQLTLLKNLGLIGGLLLAAVDTEGRPGLSYRAGHAIERSKREVKRAARTAKREAKIAVMARKIPG